VTRIRRSLTFVAALAILPLLAAVGSTAGRSEAAPAASLWPASTTPAVPAAADAAGVELGVHFQPVVDGSVTGVRFYKGAGNNGTHIGSLWTSSGTLLKSGTFTSETASGWQQLTFADPVPVQAGTSYVVGYYAPEGHYAYTSGYFSGHSVSTSDLTAPADGTGGVPNGTYQYGSAGVFPSSSYESTNYWVDVSFQPGSSLTTTTTVQSTTTTTPAPTTTSTSVPGGPRGELTSFFPIGVYVQSTSYFATWKSRGVNTVIAVPDGNSATAWDAAAAADHLYEIREPTSNADVSANVGNTNILAWSQPDEPDGILTQVPYSTIQQNYTTWKSLDPNRPVFVNFVGALNQYDLQTGASGLAWYQDYAAGADWLSSDRYPVNHNDSLGIIGTEINTLRQIGGSKPLFTGIETGAFDAGDPVITPGQFRAEVWEAIIHGVRGIWYFPVQISPTFAFDVTPANVAAEMTTQDALITQLAPVLQGAINPSSIRATVPSPLKVAWRKVASGDYFIVLNLSDNSIVNQKISVSGVGTASTASVYGESRSVAISAGVVTDNFGPYVVHIYQVKP